MPQIFNCCAENATAANQTVAIARSTTGKWAITAAMENLPVTENQLLR
jgi:hypothetical protein